MAEQTAAEWYAEHLRARAREVETALDGLSLCCAKRYHIEHAIEIMALSMGLSISRVNMNRLLTLSINRYTKLQERQGKKWTRADHDRATVFYYAEELLDKALKLKGVRKKK